MNISTIKPFIIRSELDIIGRNKCSQFERGGKFMKRRPKRKRTLEFEEIIKLYQDGNETSEIAELANVC